MERHFASSFGDLLKVFRKRKGWSQQQLAGSLHVHRNTAGLWERGERLPDTKGIVLEIARCLELDDTDTLQLLEASLTALAPPWCVPHQRNPFFTGRDEVLQELHTRLQNDPRHATGLACCLLSGPGGIGKTQTALEYVYRHLYDYQATFWISATSQEMLIASCTAIAELFPALQLARNQSQCVASVKRWLREHRGWLLVLDNVEDPTLIQDFLPLVRNGAVLLTSRRPALVDWTHKIVLQPMWAEEGALLVLRRTHYLATRAGDDRVNARTFALARRIAVLMDGLPLALDQAGAYIEETQCALVDFLSLLNNHPIALLDERNSYADHPCSVTKTFTLAYEQLCSEHRTAADLLTLCCFLAPEHIPEESFSHGASHLDIPLGSVVADAWQFNDALRHLLDYALLQRNPEAKTLSMHPLVQMVLRHHLDIRAQKYWARQALHLISASISSAPSGKWTAYEPLLLHAYTVFHCLEEVQGTEPWDESCAAEVAALQMRLAGYLAIQGRYTQAAALSQRSHDLYELYPTSMRPEFTRSLLYLADLYAYQGKDVEAQAYYERALSIQEQVLGLYHPEVTTTMIGLALLHADQKRYEQATSLLQPIAMRQQNESTNPAFQGVLLDYLASLYAKQERYEEAETHLQCAQTLWQRAQSTAHNASEAATGA